MVICWIITLVLILVVGRKLTLIPTIKFVNTVEYGYQFVRNDMGEGIIGQDVYKRQNVDTAEIDSIGITNQRETTIVWDLSLIHI